MDYSSNQYIYQQSTFSCSSQHFLGILLFLLLFIRNLPFIRRPNSCIFGLVSQPLTATYWMSLVHQQWNLCRYVSKVVVIASYILCVVSLLTMTAISVDRLVALLLRLRYKEILTLKRMYISIATFWPLSSITTLCCFLNHPITSFYGRIVLSTCVVISVVSYTKIFRALSCHQA